MASTDDRYRDDFEVESLSTDENKPSVSFFSVLISLITFCLVLLICNVTLYTQNQRLKLATNDGGFSKSLYTFFFFHQAPRLTALIAGIYARGKTWTQFHTYTKYSDINQSVSDPAWESFTTNGFVAIPHDEAADFGLPVAEDFPDDESKGVYVLTGFHDIHCVV
jgi:Mycotoxin biosynthesis protein UstYa